MPMRSLAFARLHALAREQSLTIVTDAAALHAARAVRPGVVVAAEGGDFLEGKPDRVDEAYDRWQLRHLQLTHYRVNELGDIQTENPVHGGLTDVGAEVIRRCNARGIVVDVAHGTLDLVRRAAAVTTRPLVLSHTSLVTIAHPFTRLITPEHARLVAGTGGMIGIWPVAEYFPDMAALAGGIARMAAVVGVEHVGLGTDQMGLVGPATFDSYAEPARPDDRPAGRRVRRGGCPQAARRQLCPRVRGQHGLVSADRTRPKCERSRRLPHLPAARLRRRI